MKYICALISFKNPQKIIYRTQFSILVFIILRSLILLGIFLWKEFKGLHLYKPMNPCHEDIISLIRYWELGECFESMSVNAEPHVAHSVGTTKWAWNEALRTLRHIFCEGFTLVSWGKLWNPSGSSCHKHVNQ